MGKTKAQSGKGFTVGQGCYKINSFIRCSQKKEDVVAGTPGCYQPTASQPSPEGPPAPSGNVTLLQETPSSDIPAPLEGISSAALGTVLAPAPRQDRLWAAVTPHHSETPTKEQWEKR